MKKIKYIVSASLIVTLVATCLAGCNKSEAAKGTATTSGEGEVPGIKTEVVEQKDFVWFDSVRKICKTDVSDKALLYDCSCSKDREYAVYSEGNDYIFASFDGQGEQLRKKKMSELDVPQGAYYYKVSDNGLFIMGYEDYSGESVKSVVFVYDIESDQMLDLSAAEEERSDIVTVGRLDDGSFIVFLQKSDKNSEATWMAKIVSGGSVTEEIDIGKIKDSNDIDLFVDSVSLAEDKIIVKLEHPSGDMFAGILDLKARTFEINDKCRLRSVVGDKFYGIDDEGITSIDEAGGTATVILPYVSCNCIRSEVRGSQITDVSDDGITVAGYDYESSDIYIYDFTKTTDNPNYGKKLLTLAYLKDIEADVERTIFEFNENSSDAFVQLISDYSIYRGTVDFGSVSENEALKESVNKLNAAFLSGQAPDIIMDIAGITQFQRDDLLADLAPYLSSEITSGKYYDNIIDGSKVDGKLFSMPLSFEYSCLLVPEEDASSSTVFKDYADTVRNVYNGIDPLSVNSRADYFALLMRNNYSAMIKDGRFDPESQAFRELAEYIKANVNDDPQIDRESDMMYQETAELYSDISCLDMYFSRCLNNGRKTAIGIPSNDGRGPLVRLSSSISVSAGSDGKEQAVEFIKQFMSEDIQGNFKFVFPINKAACRKTLEDQFADMEEMDQQYKEIEGSGCYNIPLNASVIDELAEKLGKLENVEYFDTEMISLSYEELQAYFAGQKDLDEVIGLISNRSSLIYNERG